MEPTGQDAAKDLPEFSFSAAAADRIRVVLEDHGEPSEGLRVGVRGGGCNGYSYFLEVAPADSIREGKDEVFEAHGTRVIVDRRSLKLLRGTLLDFDTSLIGAAFKFVNPNATQSCGCGSSFSV